MKGRLGYLFLFEWALIVLSLSRNHFIYFYLCIVISTHFLISSSVVIILDIGKLCVLSLFLNWSILLIVSKNQLLSSSLFSSLCLVSISYFYYFLLFTLKLIYSSFLWFISWKLGSLILDLPSFLIEAFKARNFPLGTAIITLYKFWCYTSILIFVYFKIFSILLCTFFFDLQIIWKNVD